MIPARKSAVFNAWFASHARSRIHAEFGRVMVHGLDATRALTEASPVLFVANHPSWWDALVALHASRHLLGVDGYAMMDEKNLAELPFFALVGAFGVDLDRAEGAAASLRYAARLLDRPRRAVWIFPQGTERPITERPLAFRPGSAALLRIARRAVGVPVALRYEHAEDERPWLFVSFGAPIEERADGQAHERAVEEELARIERAVRARGRSDEFEVLHASAPSRLAAFATTLLARLTRHESPPRLPRGGRSDRT